MAHRATTHEPEFFNKMLDEEDVRTKNYAELALYTGITDPDRLDKLFSSKKPDELFPITITVDETRFGQFSPETREREAEMGGDENDEGTLRHTTIRSFSLADVHDRSCVLAVGSRESGKTVTMYQLVATKSYFADAYATSTTDGVSGYWQSVIPPRNVHEEYDPAFQNAILSAQRKVIDKYQERLRQGEFFDPRTIIVEEDCAYEMFMRMDRALDRMGANGRHYHILPIVLVQRLHTVDTVFRENCDLIFLWKSDNRKTRMTVWEEYASFLPRDEFFRIWDSVTQNPYHVLVICSRGRDRYKRPEDRLFWFCGWKEEAVDALMGGGEIDEEGNVTKPPVVLWRVGRPWLLNPVIQQEAENDEVAMTRGREARMTRVSHGKADEIEMDEVDVRYEVTPLSWTNRTLQKYRVEQEARQTSAVESVLLERRAKRDEPKETIRKRRRKPKSD